MQKHMLTTVDNPYSPADEYDRWAAYDQAMGYGTEALLARITITSDAISETDQDLAIEDAIDVIIGEIGSGFYVKVPVSG